MSRIIINADDCGLNPDVNAAIRQALEIGAISSSTIMANSEYLADVHKMEMEFPNASFGIHLNLTEGPSILKSQVLKKYHIIDNSGNFITENYRHCFNPCEQLATAIREEWDAQLYHLINEEKFEISHVDGHHHCHTYPGLQHILVELCEKYNITRARNRYVMPVQGSINRIKVSFLHILSHLGVRHFPHYSSYLYNIAIDENFHKVLSNGKIRTSTFFCSFKNGYCMLNNGLILNDDCITEFMCHPGSVVYPEENELLMSKPKIIYENNIISYKEL